MKTQNYISVEKIIDGYIDYFKNHIAQEVHLRGIEKFEELNSADQDTLMAECKNLLSEMIKKEHIQQYGQSLRRLS